MRKTLKKTIGVLLATITIFAAASCSYNDENGGNKEQTREVISVFAQNGKSDYKVLISAEADIVEQTAASEFVKYIEQTTGCVLPVVTDDTASANVNGKYVSIGENKLFNKVKIDNTNLNKEGYVLKTIGNSLFIVGQIPKATLFGVYGFLEYEMGCKFLSAQYEYIPEYTSFELKETDERRIPAIATRCVFYDAMNTFNTMYLAPKNGYSVAHTTDPKAIGGSYWSFTSDGEVHSMASFISYSENKNKHPQWYGTAQGNMPCLSNGLNAETGEIDPNDREKDLDGNPIEGTTYIEAWINKSIEYLQEHPDCEYITFGQPDVSDSIVCNCEKCQKQLSKLNYSRSAQFMVWANTAAKYIQEWVQENCPGRKVRFARTAYAWSEGAPVKQVAEGVYEPITELCRPREDMSIWWIPINSCYIHELCDENCNTNANGTGAAWKGWKQIANDFLVFDYNVNYTEYLSYFPNMNVLQANLQEYVKEGVSSYLLEGSLGSYDYYEQDMQAWVAAKLMWNPNLDLQELVSEYNRYYYGEQAGKIADELLWYLESHFNYQAKEQSKVQGQTRCIRVYSGYEPWMVSAKTLNKLFLTQCYDYIERMRAVYDADASLSSTQREQYEENLQRFEVMIDFMKYKNYDSVSFTTDAEKYDFMVSFFDKVERLGIKKFSETGKTVYDERVSLGY